MENKESLIEQASESIGEKKGAATINLLVHDLYEAQIERLEKSAKRWFAICIVLIIVIVLTNAGWLLYESQYEDIIVTQDANTDSGGDAHIGAGVGNINYGASETESTDPTQKGE